VRDALTLERLQYCILIDEDGNKRYVRGPAVVFPLPTEKFHDNKNGNKKFRPIELNGSIQGLHIKVIAAYVDTEGAHGKKGKEYKEGDELFITGTTTPIYFPCEQHSAVKYDGKTKHFATAIPAGDGRYLLNRTSGKIVVKSGGKDGTMCLPDPREVVFVRRALSPTECHLLYPGNNEVLLYNTSLMELAARTPTTRTGTVSEGEVKRSRKTRKYASRGTALEGAEFADTSKSNLDFSAEMGGDEFSRAASYSEPRTVTLGSKKFAGVPKIDIWTGYAIMVKDTAGNRRVEVGPQRVLLNFNESLEALTLSTGKPKSTDRILKTAYLQTSHNKVSDLITVETKDHVKVNTKLSLRVDFEGEERTRWFQVPNYVKLMTDHVRSVLKSRVRKMTIEEFISGSEDLIRDTILGVKPEDGSPRPGMAFEENSMRVYDVEVLSVQIGDASINKLLTQAQHEAVESSIALGRSNRRLAATQAQEEINRKEMASREKTAEHRAKIVVDGIKRDLKSQLESILSQTSQATARVDVQKAENLVVWESHEADMSRRQAKADADFANRARMNSLDTDWLGAQTNAEVAKLEAFKDGFSEALTALNDKDTLVKVAKALSVQTALGGNDLADTVNKMLGGTKLASVAKTLLLDDK